MNVSTSTSEVVKCSQETTSLPEELLGDWQINNKDAGIEISDSKAVFRIGRSQVESKGLLCRCKQQNAFTCLFFF